MLEISGHGALQGGAVARKAGEGTLLVRSEQALMD
ncbi:hypothetical protein PFWH6_0913 [Pseudomonas fluorescens WH6]|nr:hypothetical protein PFWH6_0913 [Pseudomonas fluorescens WH6]